MNEAAVDNQLFDARQIMKALFVDEETLDSELAMTLVRLAYGKGYTDAVHSEDRVKMAVLLGLLNTETGEIC